MPNMAQTFAQAAKGNVEAQAQMLDHAVMTAFQPGAFDPQFMGIIEVWARMLATHGRAEDKMRLGGILMFKGSVVQFGGNRELAVPMIEEGARLLHEAFEQGHEPAESQRVELSRRLAMNIAIPAEVMLGDLAPTVQ